MFGICRHPFKKLAVEAEATVKPSRTDPELEVVTYHFYCRGCLRSLTVKHTRYIGDVRELFARPVRRHEPHQPIEETTP